MVEINKLINETGDFHLCNITEPKGRTIFAWTGEEDFLERTTNLVYNFGLLQRVKPKKLNSKTLFLYTTKNIFKSFLEKYFYFECLATKEYTKLPSYRALEFLSSDEDIPNKIEEEYKNEEFLLLVEQAVNDFWNNKLKHDDLKFNHNSIGGIDIHQIFIPTNGRFSNRVY